MDDERLQAEQRARVRIEAQFTASGCLVQDRRELNLLAAHGVPVREAGFRALEGLRLRRARRRREGLSST